MTHSAAGRAPARRGSRIRGVLRTFTGLLFLGAAMSFPSETSAQLRLSRLVGDGMVMQRDAAVPVWGWAEPGADVEVSFGGRSFAVRAGADGAWKVVLPPQGPGGPHEMTIASAAERVLVRDILVGDVWIASGQSNMEWTVADANDAAAEIAAASDRRIRHFKVPNSWAEQPESDLAGGAWQVAGPETVAGFSAVAYFFARELRRSVDVPVGIINTSWGGSRIEPWMSREMLGMDEAGVAAIVERQRALGRAQRENLRARIGGLPEVDAGLVDGAAHWADPALDDAGWAAIPVPGLWEQAGYEGLDGVAWYRSSFTLSASEAARGVRLGLAMIDDSDITWVNGTEVGRTDNQYNRVRLYDVPASALRTGRNVIAVRVEDFGGGGGIYGGSEALFVEVGSERRPLAGSWKFRVGAVVEAPDGQQVNRLPVLLYNRMIHPLLPYPIKGVLWYQGESNADRHEDAVEYRRLFADLVTGWRRLWNVGDFPFLFVQLAGFMAADAEPAARSNWATLRESQSAALRLPNTAQAVTLDIGDADDIHPRNKQDVGLRLALAARKVAYGQEAVVHSGPVYRSHSVENGRIRVLFDHVGAGLVAGRGGVEPSGFAIAGADGRFVWAESRVDGDAVVVWSGQVPEPVAVRYGWGNNPDRADLRNRDGLPAAPFRTDAW